jgi:hypothetical protein
MAARQLARLRQQQERLAEPAPEAEDSDSSGDDAVAPRNAFDLLMADEGDAHATEEDEEDEPAAAASTPPPAASEDAAESAKKKKKKKVRCALLLPPCVP